MLRSACQSKGGLDLTDPCPLGRDQGPQGIDHCLRRQGAVIIPPGQQVAARLLIVWDRPASIADRQLPGWMAVLHRDVTYSQLDQGGQANTDLALAQIDRALAD